MPNREPQKKPNIAFFITFTLLIAVSAFAVYQYVADDSSNKEIVAEGIVTDKSESEENHASQYFFEIDHNGTYPVDVKAYQDVEIGDHVLIYDDCSAEIITV